MNLQIIQTEGQLSIVPGNFTTEPLFTVNVKKEEDSILLTLSFQNEGMKQGNWKKRLPKTLDESEMKKEILTWVQLRQSQRSANSNLP